MTQPLPPYAQLLGLRRDGDTLLMPFVTRLIGSPGRLHGGAIAGLMEIAANMVVRDALDDPSVQLKPINVTVDYLRAGAPEDSHARATILRLGRRVAVVQVESWQADPSRLMATARINMLLRRN